MTAANDAPTDSPADSSEIRYRVLGCPIQIRCAAPHVAPLLAEAAPRAAEAGLPAGRLIEIEVRPGTEPNLVEVRHDGRLIYQHFDPVRIAVEVETLVTHLVTAAWANWTRLHAGCATIAGRRALFSGDKAAGKTTLMLGLLAAGHEVHGDENVLLRGGVTLPLPRKFHLREGSLDLVPEFASLRKTACPREHPVIGPFRFCGPTDLGRPWSVNLAPADAVFMLEPDFGGASVVSPCPKVDLVRHLLFQTVNLSTTPGREIREISQLADSAAAFRLRVGDLTGAVRAIEAVLDALPARAAGSTGACVRQSC